MCTLLKRVHTIWVYYNRYKLLFHPPKLKRSVRVISQPVAQQIGAALIQRFARRTILADVGQVIWEAQRMIRCVNHMQGMRKNYVLLYRSLHGRYRMLSKSPEELKQHRLSAVCSPSTILKLERKFEKIKRIASQALALIKEAFFLVMNLWDIYDSLNSDTAQPFLQELVANADLSCRDMGKTVTDLQKNFEANRIRIAALMGCVGIANSQEHLERISTDLCSSKQWLSFSSSF
jgi:hypothetical protein